MSAFGGSSLRGWIRLAGILAIAAGVVWLSIIGLKKGPIGKEPAKPEAAASAASGNFRLTDAQWATLSFVKADNREFRNERETDGKIAVNDDTTTPVFSPFSGRVTRLVAHAGDVVKKGDPLLMVEASEFVQAQSDLVSAAASLSAAKAQLVLTDAEEKRQHELYESKGAALKDWQQSQVDLANAQSAVKTAEISLSAVRNRLRILGRPESEIAAIEAAPDHLRMADETAVPSPIAGTVINRQVGPGEYINSAAANGNQIFTIGDLSKLWLVANLREADAPLAHPGDTVEVRVIAYPGRIFKGKLTYVAPSIAPAIRRLPVRAEIDNADGALKPEMFATFRIASQDGAGNAPAVPENAVIYEGDTARLWTADPADKSVALRQIKVGRVQDGLVEVTEGLTAGETVVTKGALFIDRVAKAD